MSNICRYYLTPSSFKSPVKWTQLPPYKQTVSGRFGHLLGSLLFPRWMSRDFTPGLSDPTPRIWVLERVGQTSIGKRWVLWKGCSIPCPILPYSSRSWPDFLGGEAKENWSCSTPSHIHLPSSRSASVYLSSLGGN